MGWEADVREDRAIDFIRAVNRLSAFRNAGG